MHPEPARGPHQQQQHPSHVRRLAKICPVSAPLSIPFIQPTAAERHFCTMLSKVSRSLHLTATFSGAGASSALLRAGTPFLTRSYHENVSFGVVGSCGHRCSAREAGACCDNTWISNLTLWSSAEQRWTPISVRHQSHRPPVLRRSTQPYHASPRPGGGPLREAAQRGQL